MCYSKQRLKRFLYISYMVLGTFILLIFRHSLQLHKKRIKIIARLVNLSDEIIEQAVVRIGDCGAVVEEYVWHTNHDLTITSGVSCIAGYREDCWCWFCKKKKLLKHMSFYLR